MTRRNNKRTERRNRRNRGSEQTAHEASAIMMGALMQKAFESVFGKKEAKEEDEIEDVPHTGIRRVDNHVESAFVVPADGTATEIPIPDGFEVFVSEDGKPMIRAKVERKPIDQRRPNNEEVAAEGEPADHKGELTYNDIARELYFCQQAYYIGGKVKHISEMSDGHTEDYDNCKTVEQAKRLLAFNKLQNIAKYLNKGWKPNFNDDSNKWLITQDRDGDYNIYFCTEHSVGGVYFKTSELAEQAVRLMGDESLADLFTTNW